MLVGTCVTALPAQGVDVQIAFANGRVTLSVADAPVAAILAEWARVGQSEIIGIDTLESRRITISLSEVTESQALAAILGDGVGFVSSLKRSSVTNQSRLASIRVGHARAAAGSDRPPRPEPPEATFSYYVPENAVLAEPAPAVNWRDQSSDAPLPETVYEYFMPEAADPRTALSETPALPDAPLQDAGALNTPGAVPERLFQYFVPEAADPKLGVPSASPPVVPKLTVPPVAPETLFQYFVPEAAAPKKPSSK
jgi:hypothetical protein